MFTKKKNDNYAAKDKDAAKRIGKMLLKPSKQNAMILTNKLSCMTVSLRMQKL